MTYPDRTVYPVSFLNSELVAFYEISMRGQLNHILFRSCTVLLLLSFLDGN